MPAPDTADAEVAAALEELQIRSFDEEIFTMSKNELREHFGFESGGMNCSLLLKNLIWQDHGMILRGELPPIYGNIRSYWYSRAKPVLARSKAKRYADKYDMMIGQFVSIIVNRRLASYSDFKFTDEGAHNRKLGGANRHVFCVAEKSGHMPLLNQIHHDYDVTIIALGGQPSALSTEYLLDDLAAAGLADRPIHLFTIVDYDPAGDSIAKSFKWQLEALGFTGEILRTDLVHPRRMTTSQIKLNRFRLSQAESERKKNQKWAAKTGGLEPYGAGLFYGLEADAMSWEQLTAAFDEEATPHLEVPRTQIIRRRLKEELVNVMQLLLLVRLGVA